MLTIEGLITVVGFSVTIFGAGFSIGHAVGKNSKK